MTGCANEAPMTSANHDFDRVSVELCATAATFSTATLHETAGRIGSLPSAIKPVASSFRISGPAFPLTGPPMDNMWLHRAIHLAKPGDVLVFQVGDAYEGGYLGDVMASAAKMRQLGGLVIDGCVRDGEELEAVGFPIFARGLCIRGTTKDPNGHGSLFAPIVIGDVTIRPGDLVVGDRNGVVVIPRERAVEVVATSAEHDAKEARNLVRVKNGETTLQIHGYSLGV
jgi:4-hydroxy-4-methyl-2-oxoglutarate aldolase